MLAIDMSFVASSFYSMVDAFMIAAAVTAISLSFFASSFVTGYLQSLFTRI